jgi:hypothetical protein
MRKNEKEEEDKENRFKTFNFDFLSTFVISRISEFLPSV